MKNDVYSNNICAVKKTIYICYLAGRQGDREAEAKLHITCIQVSQFQSAGRPYKVNYIPCMDIFNSMNIVNQFRKHWQTTEHYSSNLC